MEEMIAFRESLKSVILATVNTDGELESSYAPYVVNENNEYFVFVSALSRHTPNLIKQRQASLMFIEDESKVANIFARRRLTYQCSAEPVNRDSDKWSKAMVIFFDRFGKFVDTLITLPDFQLFRFVPLEGNYVTGFGKAYTLSGNSLNLISQVRPGINNQSETE